MPSIKDLKKRIVSVKTTQQTTRAMKMVSASKLRRAQEAITANRPYAKKVGQLIRLLATTGQDAIESPLIATSAPGARKSVLLVLVTSDRGLCGAFNSNIIKKGARWAEENRSKYSKIEFAFVGKKAFEYFKNRGTKELKYMEFGRRVTAPETRQFTNWVIDLYLSGAVEEVKFIYNEFKNAIAQEVIVEDFLPLEKNVAQQMVKAVESTPSVDLYIMKPGPRALFQSLLRKHFFTQVYRILLESQASEHGARMSAMDNATRNAKEMINKLTLQYNKQRQAGITKEILEIISGSESQAQA